MSANRQRFRLRTLIVFVAVVGVTVGLAGRLVISTFAIRTQQEEMGEIHSRGGYVYRNSRGVVIGIGFPEERSSLLTDSDVRKFPVPQLQSVEAIDLSGSAITDESIAVLKQLKSLKRLDARNTRITLSGQTEMSKALPHCTVER
jgi:hypothetical protein